jgi:hypothetical protein
MAGHTLSKSTFIRARQCTKSLYLNKFHSNLRDRISPEQMAKFRRGTDIGKLARDLFPGGVDMSPKSPTQYQKKADETAQAILNPEISVIYEAVVQHNGVLIMLDILVRNKDGWNAYEVKSSLSISETYLTDAALQYYVLHGAGIKILDFHLIIMNKDYLYDGELILNELFTSISVFESVTSRCKEIENDITSFKETLASGRIPDISIGLQCNNPYPCDFKGYCWKDIPKKSILNLGQIPIDQLFTLYNNGVSQPNQMPSESIQNELQHNIIQSFNSGKPFWNRELLFDHLSAVSETKTVFAKFVLNSPALPYAIGARPYQPQLLALATKSKVLDIETNFFNQNDKVNDESILHKIDDLTSSYHTIVVYDAYDILKFLGYQHNTELSGHIKDKILDLKEIIRQADFYHPDIDNQLEFANVTTVLLQTTKQLKNETYLVSDILLNPTGNYALDYSLRQFVINLERLINFLLLKNSDIENVS